MGSFNHWLRCRMANNKNTINLFISFIYNCSPVCALGNIALHMTEVIGGVSYQKGRDKSGHCRIDTIFDPEISQLIPWLLPYVNINTEFTKSLPANLIVDLSACLN